MKIIILITAAFFAMPSVAAAADLPIGKYPVGAAARPAPARPGALGPREQGGGRAVPEATLGGKATGGSAAVAPEQPERPIAEGAGVKPPAGVAHGEDGGGSPEHNLQPPAGGQAGPTVGGE
jgi:hypothetical protein